MKTIKLELNAASIERAINELKNFKKWIEEKTTEFITELANEGVQIASVEFQQAIYDGTNDVTVHMEEKNDHRVAVVATGFATLFIEFGTGITYNTDHPDPISAQYPKGMYGSHLGSLPNGWRYKGDPGTNGEVDMEHEGYIHTYGNPSNACMYYTELELEEMFEETARKVFKYD